MDRRGFLKALGAGAAAAVALPVVAKAGLLGIDLASGPDVTTFGILEPATKTVWSRQTWAAARDRHFAELFARTDAHIAETARIIEEMQSWPVPKLTPDLLAPPEASRSLSTSRWNPPTRSSARVRRARQRQRVGRTRG